jgi:hypothetical protein
MNELRVSIVSVCVYHEGDLNRVSMSGVGTGHVTYHMSHGQLRTGVGLVHFP